ncbi:hypothetical protein ALP52_05981 [Pseudomonas amygdali pv. mori]|uniref:Uncharacterized protein n=1 Tax=Pseudomonas amygdali pv. mori TaxID=34065 RepID=A0A3M5JEJ8_PSEA0|nr:hypothetical protein ALP52_05981 [Pseudomonas amygdali pv. mori]
MSRFDGNTCTDLQWQNSLLVGRILSFEDAGAWHGDHTNVATLLGQLVIRLHSQTDFRTGRDQDQLRLCSAVTQYIAATGNGIYLLLFTRLVSQVLTRENQCGWTVIALDGVFPGHGRFHGICRTPGVQVRRGTQAGQLLDRLVSRAVFAQTDGVVGEYVDHALLHQRGHTHRVASVFHEDQEGCAIRHEAAVQGDTIHHGAHTELTNTVVQVVAVGVFASDALAAFPDGQVGAGQVGRTTEDFRQQRAQCAQGVLTGLTAGDGFAFGVDFGDISSGFLCKVSRQLAAHATNEVVGQLRESGGIGSKALIPLGFGSQAFFFRIPLGVDISRNFERTVIPFQGRTGQGDFVRTQRRTVGFFLALLVRRAKADGGLAADQRRLVALARGVDGGLDFFRVMTVDIADNQPAVGLEALRRIVGKPAFDFAIDGDAVVVVERNQLVQLQRTGQGSDFVGNTFHHAAITHKHVGMVINDGMAWTVELCGEGFLGSGKTDGVGKPLTQWASGGFNAWGIAKLGVTRCAAVQLTEVFQVVDGQVVAGQVQQRIDQHRTMAVGHDETVTVSERGVCRVVFEIITPQNLGDIRHAHRGTRMAAVGFLHGIHA